MPSWCSIAPATTRSAITTLTTMSQGDWQRRRGAACANVRGRVRSGCGLEAPEVMPGVAVGGGGETEWLWARLLRASWRCLRASSSDGGGRVGSDIACLLHAAPSD